MKDLLQIWFVFILVGALFIVSPLKILAISLDSPFQVIGNDETTEAPEHLTQKQMNDLFGEDPYLGQTSYLQSPDGYNQAEKTK